MSMKALVGIAMLGATLVVVSGCNMFGFRSWTWRQKMTIEVNTPEGVKSGSSVVEAFYNKDPEWWGVGDSQGQHRNDVRGESVVVDLGGGRYLVNLLSEYDALMVQETMDIEAVSNSLQEETSKQFDQITNSRFTKELPPKIYPRFGAFVDINNPENIKIIGYDELKNVFGDGYSIKSIKVSITDEEVTSGKIESVLPCLRSGKFCVPPNKALPSGHPLRFVSNFLFWRH